MSNSRAYEPVDPPVWTEEQLEKERLVAIQEFREDRKQLGSKPFIVGSGGERFKWPCRFSVSVDDDNVITRLMMRDKKGGDIDEWPADLRVREFPEHEQHG